jgi:sugar/nucleoside kinase (ribokinase family)
VIVVIGSPLGRLDAGSAFAAGTAALVARAAAAAGRDVQLIGKIGDDPIADGVLIDLTRGGVGHVALLRDVANATPIDHADATETTEADDGPEVAPARLDGLRLDAADVDLGLRYLTTFDVLVLTGAADPEVLAVVAEAARWAGARLVLVAPSDTTLAPDLPPDAVAFQAPASDPDGAFATLVGTFAAALDDGADPEAAFQASIASDGWTASPDED